MNPSELNQRVNETLGKLTLEEKISLLSGKDDWKTVPIKRLGIPSITMTDGPHGVRATNTGAERMEGLTTSRCSHSVMVFHRLPSPTAS